MLVSFYVHVTVYCRKKSIR